MEDDNKPRHPGQILLEDYLQKRGCSQKALADHLEWTYARLNEIINARRGLTADSALALAGAFRTTPEFWMDLQRDWELWHAREKHQAVNPIQEVVLS